MVYIEQLIGQKVRVYYNLHKHIFSVQDYKTKRVVAYVDTITLSNVKFKVSESGRQRVLREKRKNVHAYVDGICLAVNEVIDQSQYEEIYYSPYLTPTFTIKRTSDEIHDCDWIHLQNKATFCKLNH